MLPIDIDSLEFSATCGKSYNPVIYFKCKDWVEGIAPAIISGVYEVSTIQALMLRVVELNNEIEIVRDEMRKIGDYAHENSTGPAVPDALWDVRRMAYAQC